MLNKALVVLLCFAVVFTAQAVSDLFAGGLPVPLPVESSCCTVERWTLAFEPTPLPVQQGCCPMEGWIDSGAVVVVFGVTRQDTSFYVSGTPPFAVGQWIRIDDEQMFVVDVNADARWLTVRRSANASPHLLSRRLYVWGWKCQRFKPFTPHSTS